MLWISLLFNIALAYHSHPDKFGPQTGIKISNPKKLVSSIDNFVVGTTYDFGAPMRGQGPLSYHKGSILTGETHLYTVFYGAQWFDGNLLSQYKPLLFNFLSDLQSSSWLNAAKTFTGNVSQTVWMENNVHYMNYTDQYGGFRMSDNQLEQLIADLIDTGVWPYDPNAIYMLISDYLVDEYYTYMYNNTLHIQEYGKDYCGYHSAAYDSNHGPFLYSFIGYGKCPISRFYYGNQIFHPPNDKDFDSIIGTILHEVSETQTDPFDSGWYAGNMIENGDMCAWSFGKCALVPNTTDNIFNYRIGNYFYLSQQTYEQFSTVKFYCTSQIWQDGDYTVGQLTSTTPVGTSTFLVKPITVGDTSTTLSGWNSSSTIGNYTYSNHGPVIVRQSSGAGPLQISSNTLTMIGVGIFIIVVVLVLMYIISTNLSKKKVPHDHVRTNKNGGTHQTQAKKQMLQK